MTSNHRFSLLLRKKPILDGKINNDEKQIQQQKFNRYGRGKRTQEMQKDSAKSSKMKTKSTHATTKMKEDRITSPTTVSAQILPQRHKMLTTVTTSTGREEQQEPVQESQSKIRNNRIRISSAQPQNNKDEIEPKEKEAKEKRDLQIEGKQEINQHLSDRTIETTASTPPTDVSISVNSRGSSNFSYFDIGDAGCRGILPLRDQCNIIDSKGILSARTLQDAKATIIRDINTNIADDDFYDDYNKNNAFCGNNVFEGNLTQQNDKNNNADNQKNKKNDATTGNKNLLNQLQTKMFSSCLFLDPETTIVGENSNQDNKTQIDGHNNVNSDSAAALLFDNMLCYTCWKDDSNPTTDTTCTTATQNSPLFVHPFFSFYGNRNSAATMTSPTSTAVATIRQMLISAWTKGDDAPNTATIPTASGTTATTWTEQQDTNSSLPVQPQNSPPLHPNTKSSINKYPTGGGVVRNTQEAVSSTARKTNNNDSCTIEVYPSTPGSSNYDGADVGTSHGENNKKVIVDCISKTSNSNINNNSNHCYYTYSSSGCGGSNTDPNEMILAITSNTTDDENDTDNHLDSSSNTSLAPGYNNARLRINDNTNSKKTTRLGLVSSSNPNHATSSNTKIMSKTDDTTRTSKKKRYVKKVPLLEDQHEQLLQDCGEELPPPMVVLNIPPPNSDELYQLDRNISELTMRSCAEATMSTTYKNVFSTSTSSSDGSASLPQTSKQNKNANVAKATNTKKGAAEKVTESLPKVPIENRRMAYYAVGKHHRAGGNNANSDACGNRRCYFTGKVILTSAPYYAGCVQQGMRTLVVFCLPSSLGLPHRQQDNSNHPNNYSLNNVGGYVATKGTTTSNMIIPTTNASNSNNNNGGGRLLLSAIDDVEGGGNGQQTAMSRHLKARNNHSNNADANTRSSTGSTTTASYRLLGLSKLGGYTSNSIGGGNSNASFSTKNSGSKKSTYSSRFRSTGFSTTASSKKSSRCSNSYMDETSLSVSIESDLDPNWNYDRDVLIQLLPPADSKLLHTMSQLYPEQFETLPVQVRDSSKWKLYIKFCFFTGLPIGQDELYYKVCDDIALKVYGDEIVLSHEVMIAAVTESIADLLAVPNQTVLRYIRKHYSQQCSKIPDERIFQRASWERIVPYV